MHAKKNPPTTEELADFVREFATFYIGNPENLEIRFQPARDGSACYFTMQGAPEDDSRLIGRKGCHVNALTYLIKEVGRAQGKVFPFRLITRPDGALPWFPPGDVLDYDPRPARDLLCRWLTFVGADEFSVKINTGPGPRRSLFFNFDVKIASRPKAEALTHPGRGDEEGFSTIGALGTLFRAIARQNGVRLQITLVDPKPKET